MASGIQQISNWANGHHRRVVAFAIMGILVGGALTYTVLPQVSQAPAVSGAPETAVTEAVVVADPVRLRVPSVGIDTSFVGPLGLNDDQTVEVPDGYDEVGWYQYGPKPGELGPAVVLGHVDSFQGPAVFWPLQQVTVGDVVEIERADGSVAVFTVTALEQHQQAGFPTAKVYGDIDHAGLRLITCSGTFNRGQQVYSHNLIVFAELVENVPALNASSSPAAE